MIKVEAIHGERIRTREVMRRIVFAYIEVDYNRNRRNSANRQISPEAFVLVNLNWTHLFEILETLRLTYSHCSKSL